MFRNRILWAGLAALSVLPLTGCLGRRCCNRDSSSYRPAFYAPVAAPACNSCQTSNAPPVILAPG